MSDTTQSDVVVDSSPQVEVVESPVVAKVETKEPENAPVATETHDEEPDETSLPNGVKKRIDKLTRQKYETVAENNRLRAELEWLKSQSEPRLEKPDISKYEDFESYAEALAGYKYQQKTQETQKQQAQLSTAQQMQQEWSAKVDAIKKTAPDFDAVFASVAEVEFAPQALEAIAQHPKGAEIAYTLGKEISEAYRIAALPPYQQLMAIGALAERSNVPKPKTVSTAPPPVKPVVSNSPSQKSVSDMTDKEYAEFRAQQIKQRRR